MFDDLKGKTALILSRYGEIDVEIAQAIAKQGCNLILAFGQAGNQLVATRLAAEFDVRITWLPIDDRNTGWRDALRRQSGSLAMAVNLVDGCGDQSVGDDVFNCGNAADELEWQLRTISLVLDVMTTGCVINYIKPADRSAVNAVSTAVLHSGLVALAKAIDTQIATEGLRITNVFAERSGAASARRAQVARSYRASPLAVALAGISEQNDLETVSEIINFVASDHLGLLSGATLDVHRVKPPIFQQR